MTQAPPRRAKRAPPPQDDDIIVVREVQRRKVSRSLYEPKTSGDEVQFVCEKRQPKRRAPATEAQAARNERAPAPRTVAQQREPTTVVRNELVRDEIEVVSEQHEPDVVLVRESGPHATCGICFDDEGGLHRLGSCRHGYCTTCVMQYLRVLATETKKYPVACPGCSERNGDGDEGTLDVWRCVDVLRGEDAGAADALARLAIENTAVKSVRYCSNAACATPFDYSGTYKREDARVDCPLCNTATCVLCTKPWHDGECEPTEEERALRADKRYQTCPKCRELVERAFGCSFIRCRCGAGFCFSCGKQYRSLTATSGNAHGQPGCNCGLG